jgi:signal transduction histidine kinase
MTTRQSELRSAANRAEQASLTDPVRFAALERTHIVQFYESDSYHVAIVADFLGAGLRNGQPALALATADHREAFIKSLEETGMDVGRALESGQLRMLDAQETLRRIMCGALPDAARFHAALDHALRGFQRGTQTSIRAYGEMVDLLWKEGNGDGAVRLEELWNELAARHDITVLCAYSMTNFDRQSHSAGFDEICRRHRHVLPTERFTAANAEESLLEITRLQQRAKAVAGEVTARKALEGRLGLAAAELESLLEKERLAREQAKAADSAKEEFLAAMSHELRTPLNAIAGYVQLLEMGVHGPVTEQQRAALARVQRSQRHLLSLVNDILNLVRVERNRLEYAVQFIPLGELLTDVAAMVEQLLKPKGLRLRIGPLSSDVDALPTAIQADRDKVQQILINLLSNAIEFTDSGGEITMGVALNASPDMVSLYVRDPGSGIPASKLKDLFEPFVQFKAANAGDRGGVGLGLAISRDLARAMGGDIRVASIVGQGTTVIVDLPRA